MALLGQTVYTVTEKNDYHLQPQSFFKSCLEWSAQTTNGKLFSLNSQESVNFFLNMSDCIQNEQHQLKTTIVSMEFAM